MRSLRPRGRARRGLSGARAYLRQWRTLSSVAAIMTARHWSNSLCSQIVQRLSEQVFSLLNYQARHYEEKQKCEEQKNTVWRNQPTIKPASVFTERYESREIKTRFTLTCSPPPKKGASITWPSIWPRGQTSSFLLSGPGCFVRQQFLFATAPQISFPWFPHSH